MIQLKKDLIGHSDLETYDFQQKNIVNKEILNNRFQSKFMFQQLNLLIYLDSHVNVLWKSNYENQLQQILQMISNYEFEIKQLNAELQKLGALLSQAEAERQRQLVGIYGQIENQSNQDFENLRKASNLQIEISESQIRKLRDHIEEQNKKISDLQSIILRQKAEGDSYIYRKIIKRKRITQSSNTLIRIRKIKRIQSASVFPYLDNFIIKKKNTLNKTVNQFKKQQYQVNPMKDFESVFKVKNGKDKKPSHCDTNKKHFVLEKIVNGLINQIVKNMSNQCRGVKKQIENFCRILVSRWEGSIQIFRKFLSLQLIGQREFMVKDAAIKILIRFDYIFYSCRIQIKIMQFWRLKHSSQQFKLLEKFMKLLNIN